jgi:hypothetical protein
MYKNPNPRLLTQFPYCVGILFIVLAIAVTSCQSPLSASQVTPAPTPQCVEPTLMLGTLKYRIESVTRDSNTFPDIPQKKKKVAYWVQGTTINYVFGLSPTEDNLALNTVLKVGDPAIISWADCSKDGYTIKSIDPAPPRDLNIFDQSIEGLTVYVRTDTSTLVIRGEKAIAQSRQTSPLMLRMNSKQMSRD